MVKRDFKKELRHLYNPSKTVVSQVDVPPLNFLMIDGKGDPNIAQEYADAIEALFFVAYTIKFMIKKGDMQIDYGVMPLEGLWWADDMFAFETGNKDTWKWTAMIMQPEFVTHELVANAMAEVERKKKPNALSKMRYEIFHEGLSAQIMHIGPFSDEKPNIDKVHQFIKDAGVQHRGKHHEIYLSDIRRAAPEKWRTVIRQPMG